MPLHVFSTLALCAHHQEVKIVLYSIWYHLHLLSTCARDGYLQAWWYV